MADVTKILRTKREPVETKPLRTARLEHGNSRQAISEGPIGGNPGGDRKNCGCAIEIARSYAPDAIKTLASIMLNEDSPPAARLGAASASLDRGFGKAPQAGEMLGPDDGPIHRADFSDADRVVAVLSLFAKANMKRIG